MAGIKTIRDNLTGTFSKIIVGAIAVTFAMFFGWGTMFSNSDVNIIASVNGEKIDLYDLDLEMARVQSILAQRFEDPDFTVEEETLKTLALNSLITDALILDFLKQNQIEVLDLTAYKLLSKNEIFQDNGEFSLEKVNTFARQNGFLPGKYIESISDDIAINYWRMGLGASSFITSKELNQNIKLANQTRDVTFTKINQAEIEGSIKLADEEVLNFFEENPSLFQSEEKAKVNFIEISLKDLEEKLLIDEVVIKNEYQAYLDSFDSTIRRSASHLMITISEERNEEEALLLAGEIKEKIENGIDFQELVQEFSDDEGTKNSGGSLGVSDGNAFPEEFEVTLENMEEGQVSNPIFLETSIHLLKLTNIQTPIPEEYELKKGGIKQSLVEEAANLEYIDLIELAAELTYTSDNLEAFAKELNTQIKTKNFFSKGEAEGLFKERSLLNSIFDDPSVKKGSMSELIEINNQYGIVFELEGFQEKKTKDFKSVKEEAKSLLTNNLIREKMNLLERSMVGKMDGGSSLEEVSKENELKVESYKSVSRDSSLFTQNALEEIFNEPKSNIGRSYSSVSLTNGDTLIFRLDKVTYLNNEVADDQKDSLESFFSEERSESELVDLQISMQDSASVFIN
jgi:peptidyl-prolyl cis-trans isomerase D